MNIKSEVIDLLGEFPKGPRADIIKEIFIEEMDTMPYIEIQDLDFRMQEYFYVRDEANRLVTRGS